MVEVRKGELEKGWKKAGKKGGGKEEELEEILGILSQVALVLAGEQRG